MSYEIPVNFINQFRSNLEIGLQQKGSKLEQCVRTEVQKAEFDFYDKIGATSARKVTERHGDTPLVHHTIDVESDWLIMIGLI